MQDEKISPGRLVVFILIYLVSLFVLSRLVFKLGVFKPEGPQSVKPVGVVATQDRPAAPGSASPSRPRVIRMAGQKPSGVEIVTDRGTFTVTLLWRGATNAAANFATLAEKGFYAGTRFHYASGKEIAGGDPNTKDNDPANDGKGGPGYTIYGEINLRPHVAGSVAMVKGPDPNSAGSQFYVALMPMPERNGKDAVFGQVSNGLDVVRRLRKGDRLISARVLR